MNYSIIAAPLIGAVIGYATNYIAIKMMFRPRTVKKIGRFRVPFTPGIIPKGKPRLAKAIGSVIESSLLSKETLEETLLSDEMKEKVSHAVHEVIKKTQDDGRTIQEVATTYIDANRFDVYKANAIDFVAHKIDTHLSEHPVGDFIAQQVVHSVKENVKGGFISLVLTDNIMNTIAEKIQQRIDDYLEENTISLVVPPMTEECDKLLAQPMNSVGDALALQEETLTATFLNIYEDLVKNRLQTIFDSLNIASIVEAKINAMEVTELEALILSVMKKELNAIVNLGALIGFVLGLFNLLF